MSSANVGNPNNVWNVNLNGNVNNTNAYNQLRFLPIMHIYLLLIFNIVRLNKLECIMSR